MTHLRIDVDTNALTLMIASGPTLPRMRAVDGSCGDMLDPPTAVTWIASPVARLQARSPLNVDPRQAGASGVHVAAISAIGARTWGG